MFVLGQAPNTESYTVSELSNLTMISMGIMNDSIVSRALCFNQVTTVNGYYLRKPLYYFANNHTLKYLGSLKPKNLL